ncbi:MAG: hypothetical protein ABFC42_09375 [Sulfuricella sp.]
MARARNIKPGFFRNADLVELPVDARILFIGLWTIADRAGRLEDRPKQIKMELFPADNMDCDDLLNKLAETGMVVRYEVSGKRYLQVTNFVKHQNPHRDEKASTIPAMPSHDAETEKHDASTVQAPCEEEYNTVAIGLNPDVLNPESLLLNPESKHTAKKTRRDEYSDDFLDAWSFYPSRPGANKAQSFKAWNARISECVNPRSMIDGVVRYSKYCVSLSVEPKYIKQPATFFGPDRHFESDWTPPDIKPKAKTPAPENFATKDYGQGGRI